MIKSYIMDTRITKRRQFIKNRSTPLTIGFTAIADFSSSIGQEYIAGITAATSDYGIDFINMADAVRHTLFAGINFLPQYLQKTQFMKQPLLDGLITWASTLCDYMEKERVQNLFSSLAPLPMVDIGYLDIPGVPSIRIDNAHSMHLLLEHLTGEHGFTRFAFVGASSSRPHTLRMECFVSELTARHLSCHGDDIFMAASLNPDDIIAQAQKIIGHYMRDGKLELDAIVTSSDIIAAALIAEFEKQGISVPNDVAVTGFNNQYPGITTTTPVTTIDLVYYKRGYEAVELLIDRIMGLEADSAPHRVKTSLIVRQSCGCFENSVIDALYCHASRRDAAVKESEDRTSESDVRSYLNRALRAAYIADGELLESLIEAVITDMYDTGSDRSVQPGLGPQYTARSSHILTWFRDVLKSRKSVESGSSEEKISALRRIIMPLVKDNAEQRERMENICHALRALHAVITRYDVISRRGESYAFTNMAAIALSFTSVTTTRELEQVLRFKLSELGIPGIILVLSPNMTRELTGGAIQTIIPEPSVALAEKLPCIVREPAVFPKRFFPQASRLELVLSILSYNGLYMGYAFITMNSRNMALYDNIRELLSQTLYALYLKEGKIRENAMLFPNMNSLMSRIPLEPEQETTHGGNKLSADSIISYLIEHLGEMTDLDAIAAHFGLSKSHIARRTKELTGYSVQVLHERLKVEQAKELIRAGSMKMLDISSRLGFSNPNYFSNVFKKVTGESPRTWQAHNQRQL